MIVYKEYNRASAVAYARRWALERNPLFINFAGRGGDCTNFVSQCVFAGAPIMNFTDTFGWYYISPEDRAPAWSGVEEFFDFFTGESDFISQNGGIGPYGVLASRADQIAVGDIIQLQNQSGDFYHTLIISGFRGGEVLVCAQSNDALDRPLSSYNYAGLRVIHIEGARIDIDTENSFRNILEGTAILPVSELS